jgi:Post-segregation antitoxin CcdA
LLFVNHNIYLPDDISAKAKAAGINLSATLRSAIVEQLEGNKPLQLWCGWNHRSAYVLAVARTREEAIDKAKQAMKQHAGNYVLAQDRLAEIDLNDIEVMPEGTFVETGLR